MKVKVENKIYDGDKEPVMVILTERDRQLIADMSPDSSKYCQYPDEPKWVDNNYAGIKEWMSGGEEDD